MIKNKDGSYNKFSLLILGAIAAIVILMIASEVTDSTISIDTNIILVIGLIVSGTLILYYGYKRKPIHNSMDPVKIDPIVEITPSSILSQPVPQSSYVEVPPVSEIDKQIDESLKQYDEKTTTTKSSGFGVDMVSMILTLIVAAVTMMVGLTVVNSLVNSMPKLPEGSPFSTTQTEIFNNLGTAFNFMGLGLLILGVMVIIGLVVRVTSD